MRSKYMKSLFLAAIMSASAYAGSLQAAEQSDEKTITVLVTNDSSYIVYRLWLYPSGNSLLGEDLFGNQILHRNNSFNLHMRNLSSCYVDATAELTHNDQGSHAGYVYGSQINVCTDEVIYVTNNEVY